MFREQKNLAVTVRLFLFQNINSLNHIKTPKGSCSQSHGREEIWLGWGSSALGRASLGHNKETAICSRAQALK